MCALSLLLAACGHGDRFEIHAHVQGLGQGAVEMMWNVDGVLQRARANARDGRFTLAGISPGPTVVDVVTADQQPLFTLVAANGDDIKAEMVLGRPASLTVKGSKANELVARFVRDYDSIEAAGDVEAVNRAVAAAVAAEPSSPGAALLLVTRFHVPGHEKEADSLMQLLAPEARPKSLVAPWTHGVGAQPARAGRAAVTSMTFRTGRDTTVRLTPSMQSYALLAFTSLSRSDTVYRRLKELEPLIDKRRFRLVEVTLGGDSASWRRFIRTDSARWDQAWVPGGAGNAAVRHLGLPRTPYFLLIDSAGAPLYRGPSATRAAQRAKALAPRR